MIGYVALYCRLSPRPDGSYEGVEAQERWGREYAAKTWPGRPIEVFADAGVSAAGDDLRPEFERFRKWLTDGKIAHVWAVEQYRIERNEVRWFRLAAELDAAGISELHTNRDGIVRVQDDVAGIKAVLGAGEVRRIKRRVNDMLAEKAALGLPGGGRRFGYRNTTNDDGVKTYEHDPVQAEALRWAAEKVLSGWALENIAAALRARGVTGTHGGALTGKGIRRVILSPISAGFRVYRDRIVGKGNWPPILDEDTWRECQVRLTENRSVTRSDGREYPIATARHVGSRAGRRYLLTGGITVCGVCGARMVASMKQLRNREPKPYYLCHPKYGGKSCVGILGVELEEHVRDRLFEELDKPEFLESVAADDHDERREALGKGLQDIERRRRELAALWGTPGELTDVEWKSARQALAVTEQKLRTELAELPPPAVHVDIAAVREAWPGMLLDEQREFVRLFVERVTIKRARPGLKAFDGERAVIDWRKR
ncbi:Recombinase zinc beta ribbon domain-containing protein [Amycolatopsis tolypomycina]|uniref:Recombinase zinc beta ribbon domain-containing protein n=1 Tax=Amycolatopsis tolypomycina TaxID=208445 RepID=A0A1H4WP96_9PSEU|nr:recombinase family protein [Amycolatopsis tolypomycina]SEC95095.1 Recombinase zinc beta ribbon domain-containing protein [Amycolatopsis tolypomycina]